MNLIMLDIDGTLTQSYEYDREIFGLAIAEVIHGPPVDADLNIYIDKTSSGVTSEAIQRLTGNPPEPKQVEEVKRRVLKHLERMYRESPLIFRQVPGASQFLERLRILSGTAIAIATGCWRNEAMFKLQASGLSIEGIPLATSDDDRNRLKIMELAARRGREYYGCKDFERTIYLGDGPWDLQASRSLGFDFIGIGPRVQVLMDAKESHWHPDYQDIEAVFTSITSILKP
jgi:phosphoglycolate phosphatase-like HAD superfamily hydrolase